MKKIYFLFFLVFGLNGYAQNPNDIVYIPNANFKAKLLQASSNNSIASSQPVIYYPLTDISVGSSFSVSNYNKIDINNDGQIQVSEAEAITYLNLDSSNIANITGIEAFVNLQYLNCYGLSLNSVNLSQNTSLLYFNCSFNNLSSLDISQNLMLKELSLEYNSLSILDISQHAELEGLECRNNQLTSLDVSQNLSLKSLWCSGNPLNTINVSQNPLLISFDCGANMLTTLDVSQNPLLQYLRCISNQLSSLDVTHNSLLKYLDCTYNHQLTSLDVSQNPVLYRLLFDNISQYSQLKSLFLKNGNVQSWYQLSFYGNPLLRYVCADEDDLPLVQQRINSYGLSNICHVNSYCSFTPNGTYYTIQGNNKLDIDNNGCNSSDINYPNLRIEITNGTSTGSFIANATGNYSIPVDAGSHTLTPQLENSDYFTVLPTSTTISFPMVTSPYNQNFCITANGVKNDLEVTIIPIEIARPGFGAYYKIIYKNKGNQVSNGSLNFTFEGTIMDLVSVIPVNTSSANNSLSWNFSNLNPFETREIDLVFNINSPMATPAVNGGDVLVYTATIVGATDETPNDNTFTLNQTVVNSYDPNDKTCLEGATITPSMVGQYVHYVIRFENTGTYPAQNIVVADVIDSTKFDISTLIPQRSSHDFYTRIKGNKVEFIFENINLPFDDANNDGYVAFKIKTKSNLVLGNTFTNKANIYFDYNFPIITNTASTTVTALNTNDFDFGNYFTVYPNPVKDVLNFKVNKEIGVKSISVYNTLGQILMAITNVDNLKEIDVSNLTAGSYFVKVYTDKGSSSSKFIKQ